MIKRDNKFVLSELDEFWKDLNTDNKKIKLLTKFDNELNDVHIQFNNLVLGKPKKRKIFKPKIKKYKTHKKNNNCNKGIF